MESEPSMQNLFEVHPCGVPHASAPLLGFRAYLQRINPGSGHCEIATVSHEQAINLAARLVHQVPAGRTDFDRALALLERGPTESLAP